MDGYIGVGSEESLCCGYNIWSFWSGVKALFSGRNHSAGTPLGYDMTGRDKDRKDSAGHN